MQTSLRYLRDGSLEVTAYEGSFTAMCDTLPPGSFVLSGPDLNGVLSIHRQWNVSWGLLMDPTHCIDIYPDGRVCIFVYDYPVEQNGIIIGAKNDS